MTFVPMAHRLHLDPHAMEKAMHAIEQVRAGMEVYDAAGDRVGTVDLVKLGNPEQATTRGSVGAPTGVIDALTGGGPDAPEPLRERLLRYGYLEIDGPGITDTDRYVRADLIDRVEADSVRLSVGRDRLVEEV